VLVKSLLSPQEHRAAASSVEATLPPVVAYNSTRAAALRRATMGAPAGGNNVGAFEGISNDAVKPRLASAPVWLCASATEGCPRISAGALDATSKAYRGK
jgi:hypothetical protein